MPAKKQKTLSKMWQNFLKKLKKALQKLQSGVQSFPGWVRNRPAAFQKWRKESRKKKRYRSFRLQKKIRPEPRDIPSVGELVKKMVQFLWQHKKVFLSIALIHILFYIVFIRSPLATDMSNVQTTIDAVLGEESHKTPGGVAATLGTVLSTTGNSENQVVGAVSILLMSLVYIWAIRELHTKTHIKARDAYYQAMAPILSGALVCLVLSMQLIPFAVAALVYNIARTGGLFATGFEDLSFFLIAVFAGLLSLYWIVSTIIALYIVTLPGMYPMTALRSAKKLVQFQRFTIFKRIFSLPLVLGVFYLLALGIVIFLVPERAFLVAEVMQFILLPIIHTYMYKLYRSLI